LKIYNRYLLTVSFSLLLTTVILVAIGLSTLEAFYSIYILEALVITELYVYFNSKARRGLTFASIVLFAGFLLAVCFQAVKILT